VLAGRGSATGGGAQAVGGGHATSATIGAAPSGKPADGHGIGVSAGMGGASVEDGAAAAARGGGATAGSAAGAIVGAGATAGGVAAGPTVAAGSAPLAAHIGRGSSAASLVPAGAGPGP
jgi:hypothetical protein